MNVETTVDAFLAAMEAGDAAAVERLIHPGIQVSYNFAPMSFSKAQFIDMQRAVDRAATRKFTLIERHVVGARVIQRHRLSLVTHAGTEFAIDAALFLTVENGLVTAIEEYLDSAQLNHDIVQEGMAR